MKLKAITAMMALGACMIGAELWDGKASSCKIESKQNNSSIAVENGRAVFRAEMDPSKSRYFQFAIQVPPFKIGDQSLSVKVHVPNLHEGHCFYARGIDASNKLVISFYTYANCDKETTLVMTPMRSGVCKWFADSVTGELDSEIVRLQFLEHCPNAQPLEVAVSEMKLVPTPELPKPLVSKDYGMAVKGGTARGVFAVAAEDGREYLLVWLMDNLNKRNLQIDVETGETTVVTIPNTQRGDAVYSSILASNGKCYTQFGHRFYEYDVTKKAFTADFDCGPHQAAMSADLRHRPRPVRRQVLHG